MAKLFKLFFIRLLKSFKYALRGFSGVAITQPNFIIHLLAIGVVFVVGYIKKISLMEWGLVVLAIGLVLIAEIFNTAVEWLGDQVSPDYKEKVKWAKDAAAGGVLVAAGTAILIAIIVFIL
jgi:undecaprenol kinase/diacylglycerol kinase (ATP)